MHYEFQVSGRKKRASIATGSSSSFVAPAEESSHASSDSLDRMLEEDHPTLEASPIHAPEAPLIPASGVPVSPLFSLLRIEEGEAKKEEEAPKDHRVGRCRGDGCLGG